MTKRLIVILLILSFYASKTQAQINNNGNQLRETISNQGQVRVLVPMPGASSFAELTKNVSISSVKGKTVEVVLSKRTVEWFIAQNFSYQILESGYSKNIIMASSFSKALDWTTYPTYTQYDSIMQSFQALYPSLCHLDTIGVTIYGKYVLALKISDNAGTDEDEPETFYSSTIHGDETGGFILMLRLADYLLKNYTTNERVRNLVDNLEIWINPLANPDGIYKTGNTISSPVRYNANGYDLNRNFPDPITPGTVKQPETLDMVKFMRGHHFVLSANFHSGEEVVNYPWDRWYRLHADNDWFYFISRKYADTVHVNSVPGYMTFLENGVTNGYDWYDITGGRQDFITYELHGREVTIELDNAYVTPAANLNSLWLYNYRSLLGYLENALNGIHGYVKDIESSAPVTSRIFITGYDKDSSHVYSDTITGSFIRFLLPGTYNLLFTANGYVDKNVTVVVIGGEKTELNVEMASLLLPIDTVETPVLRLIPNPVYEKLHVGLPQRLYGPVRVSIYNMQGQKLKDYYDVAYEDIPLLIDVNSFSRGIYYLVITNLATRISENGRFVVVHR